MFRLLASCALLLALVMTQAATAGNVEFAYNGRVRAHGAPFDGTGQFKFAIIDKNTEIRLWSNDGVTLTNAEPTTSIPIAVSNGFFDVLIGDTSITNMAPLDASIFNTDERLRLRVWFNDGVNGFQLLTPDRNISNARLIGLESDNGTTGTIYVNAATGNDTNAGTTPGTAKKTIQGAWDAVPSLVSSDVTIQMAAGEYYGSATLSGKLVNGTSRIILRGDEVNSTSVRIIGAANRGTSNTTSVNEAILLLDQSNVRFTGLYFDRSNAASLKVMQNSNAEVNKCQFWNTYSGVTTWKHSRSVITNCLFSDTLSGPTMQYCIYVDTLSSVELDYSQLIHTKADNTGGIVASSTAHFVMGHTTIQGFNVAVTSQYLSYATYRTGGNVIKNCNIGTRVSGSSLIQFGQQAQGYVTYQSVTTSLSLLDNSQNVS